ncbi:ferredoxin [Rhizobium sp. ACO-34A]|nr:4Fe-4S dicluster domain-containing protein [Rhizobium sp. ACO-34A]ATN34446.1 ferredoxin [Rhizobium sp. ACO-34A]
MSGPLPILDGMRSALTEHGLHVRGVAHFSDGQGGPALSDGRQAQSVVLIGNIGGSLWKTFSDWREKRKDRGGTDPLDAWSKEVIGEIAGCFGATAYYPSDPPYQPFQQWAIKAEGLKASPLGILIHPQYGLWHGYRGALGFAEDITEERVPPDDIDICGQCPDKPCLSTCPAMAVCRDRFDVVGCRTHLVTTEGKAGCMTSGCLARAACPVGSIHRYPEAQLRFHMEALRLPPG